MNPFPTLIVFTASMLLMLLLGCTKTDEVQKPSAAVAPGMSSSAAQPSEPIKGGSEAEKIRRLLEAEAAEREAAEVRRKAFAQSFKDGSNAPLKEYKY